MSPRGVQPTHLDKVFFPSVELTKRDVVAYYEQVADTMLPHLRGRLLTMHRWPDGLSGPGFRQEQVPEWFPDWVHTVRVTRQGRRVRQLVVERKPTLVFLAQQACLTPHVGTARVQRPEHPDRLVLDLDPVGEDFGPVRDVAHDLRVAIERRALVPFVMTTGSRGLHLHVPIAPTAPFDRVRAVAEALVAEVGARHPRAIVDAGRNAPERASVAPYAIRARPAAPVATPIAWDELDDELGPRSFTTADVLRRLAERGDPWAHIESHARPLG